MSKLRRNAASLRHTARNLVDKSLLMTRRLQDEGEKGEGGSEALQRLAGIRPELEAAHDALGSLLEELEEAEEDGEDLQANVASPRTPPIVTREPDREPRKS